MVNAQHLLGKYSNFKSLHNVTQLKIGSILKFTYIDQYYLINSIHAPFPGMFVYILSGIGFQGNSRNVLSLPHTIIQINYMHYPYLLIADPIKGSNTPNLKNVRTRRKKPNSAFSFVLPGSGNGFGGSARRRLSFN